MKKIFSFLIVLVVMMFLVSCRSAIDTTPYQGKYILSEISGVDVDGKTLSIADYNEYSIALKADGTCDIVIDFSDSSKTDLTYNATYSITGSKKKGFKVQIITKDSNYYESQATESYEIKYSYTDETYYIYMNLTDPACNLSFAQE